MAPGSCALGREEYTGVRVTNLPSWLKVGSSEGAGDCRHSTLVWEGGG